MGDIRNIKRWSIASGAGLPLILVNGRALCPRQAGEPMISG
jgi:hypothetical protein